MNDFGGARDGLGEGGRAMADAVVASITAAGGTAIANADSVADPDGADALVAQALDTWGRVDVVVNNAGITGQGNFADPESYQRVYGVHLVGTVNVLRAVWPHFTEHDYGRVVNTTSGSVFGAAGSGDYAAAKGGVFALSRNLAQDHADTNIKVNAIMPMAFTRMTAAIPHPPTVDWLEKWFAPEKSRRWWRSCATRACRAPARPSPSVAGAPRTWCSRTPRATSTRTRHPSRSATTSTT